MRSGLLLAVLLLALSGCVAVNTPITGFLYNEASGPNAVGSGEMGSKTGTACSKGVLGVVWGDASIEAAKNAGDIKKIAHVDHTVTTVLAVYARYCTVVRGD